MRGPAQRPVVAATKNSDLVRDRREQLVRASIQVFTEKGFHAATVRDIGRAAGLTQGTIYNYVRSKEDILFLVCDRIVMEYQDSVRKALAVEGDAIARLRTALAGIVRVMADHKPAILLLYHESHNLDRRSLRVVLARVDEFIKSFEPLLLAARRAHGLPAGNVRLLANIVTYLPTMLALRKWALPREMDDDDLVVELVDFMLRGLGMPASQRARPSAALRQSTVS
jgi:AcrR family transcriptional regulator